MSSKVTVIDYGIGNLFSVCRAFETSGAVVKASRDPKEILNSDRVVLPGVGAFKDCVDSLAHYGLTQTVLDYCKQERPFLGICVGMQMLFSTSNEFEVTKGLGILEGSVSVIPQVGTQGEKLKVPNIGWCELEYGTTKKNWENSILNTTPLHSSVYFVHSFAAYPEKPEDVLAYTRFGGHPVTAAIQRDHIFGTQFHPERSAHVGLNIVKSFLSL